jgi:prepilin-type N-terminal cleavage/methylation domain-containing protein
MFTRSHRRGFTLIELLVVMGIILLLAGLLLTGINAVRLHVARSAVRMEIQNMMTALVSYYDEFNDYPPGGEDLGTGTMGDSNDPIGGMDFGSGQPNAPEDDVAQLQLRALTVRLAKDGGNQYVGPYYPIKEGRIDGKGRFTDRFGSPYRYLTDGRREKDPNTGLRLPSRVQARIPVIWSVGEDLTQDLANDNEDSDDPPNGKIDDVGELENDICSWFD